MTPPSPALERLHGALDRLRRDLGEALVCTGDREHLRLVAGPLSIAIDLGAALTVRLEGWSHAFPLGAEDLEDDLAEVDAALDLIGAALFGDARVLVACAGETPRAWTLQLRRRGAWIDAGTCGRRPWSPFTRRSERVVQAELARPPGYAAAEVPALPSAPWLGLAGFSRADAAAAPAALPIDGVLDLHNFSPKEVKPLVLAYLEQCRARGLASVRIVHGKGIGNLRRTVHALLERHPHVVSHRLGGHGEGSWGATLVELAPPDDADA